MALIEQDIEGGVAGVPHLLTIVPSWPRRLAVRWSSLTFTRLPARASSDLKGILRPSLPWASQRTDSSDAIAADAGIVLLTATFLSLPGRTFIREPPSKPLTEGASTN